MFKDIEKNSNKILEAIIKTMKIKGYNLCPCGSGKKYKKCCSKKDYISIFFAKKQFEKLTNYKKSQNNYIKNIPLGLWNDLKKTSINRLKCIYPNCNNTPVKCHLIPKNILKKNFGTHCLEWTMTNEDLSKYSQKGTETEAGVELVFCSKHDNDLFLDIDNKKINLKNKKKLFLLSFKSLSFSLRKTQYLMGINLQLEIFRPFLYLKDKTESNQKVTIKITKETIEQYIRLQIAYKVLKIYVKCLEKKQYNNFFYFYKVFKKYKEKIFFYGFLNPLYDLYGQKINNIKTTINLSLNIFTEDTDLVILFVVPPDSVNMYKELFRQLKQADTTTFIKFINKLIKESPDKPLVAEDFDLKNGYIKI